MAANWSRIVPVKICGIDMGRLASGTLCCPFQWGGRGSASGFLLKLQLLRSDHCYIVLSDKLELRDSF